MRTADLFRLAVSALWQQKARTLLTTLGVLLGACMLTFSLSIGQGVQDALNRQFRKNDDLRRIQVFPGRPTSSDDTAEVPAEVLKVAGVMSDAKRERIRQMLARQWRAYNAKFSPIPLSPELMARLRTLPHVERVDAVFFENGRLEVGGRSMSANFRPALVSTRGLEVQLVAGSIPPADSSHAVLVHEFLLYQLGVRDDAAVGKAIGKPVRLQLFNNRRSPKALLTLFDANALTLTSEESDLLEKAMRQLPIALDKLTLSATERETLRQLLKRRDIITNPPEPLVVSADFTLAGVLRELTPEEEKALPFYDRLYRFSDVVIPQDAGVELCEKLPRRRDEGFNSLNLVVDREENVRGVVEDLKKLGLEHYSAVEFVELVLREIRLIRFATSFIAAVALLVAGLGITNTMVTGVLERTQEIGIMKAVGARDRHIQAVFLIEGTMLGLIGSGLGLVAAWLLSLPGEGYARKLMEQQTRNQIEQQLFVFPVWLLLAVPLFVMLVTTFAAVYPARRAARVDPIVALRHE